jgi:transcription elongation factor Elf1
MNYKTIRKDEKQCKNCNEVQKTKVTIQKKTGIAAWTCGKCGKTQEA